MQVRSLLIVAALTLPQVANAGYVEKAREADLQRTLSNEGLNAAAIEAVRKTAYARAVQKLCGSEYVSDSFMQFILAEHIQQTGVPSAIFIRSVAKYGAYQISVGAKDPVKFCEGASGLRDRQG